MDTLQNMRMFVQVVETGSFTAAAQQTNTTTAQASRAIADLESHLRTRLLHRTTRRLTMTEAGERYFQRCDRILAYVEEAEAEAGDALARPSGRLRVHSMTGFGQHYIVPMVRRYQECYPLVTVELTLAQRVPDLLDERYDVSIVQAKALPDSGLVAQRLGSAYSIACASPAYVGKHGRPGTPSELSSHVCLELRAPGSQSQVWYFDGPEGREEVKLGSSKFTVNVAEAMASAIREGMGIGILPTSSALPYLKSGALVRVFPEHVADELQIFALYASRQYLDAKIRSWVDFLKEQLPVTLSRDGSDLNQHISYVHEAL